MRPSLAVLSRASRPAPRRRVQWPEVLQAAQSGDVGSALRRLAPRPQAEDVVRSLPLLESSQDANAVGEFALRTGVAQHLSAPFVRKWLTTLPDPFRAISIWKRLPDQSNVLGASLYLAANQPDRARQLVGSLPSVPPALMRELVATNLRMGREQEAQAWVDRWQAPRPEDVRWLHHLARTGPCALRLPALDSAARLPEPRLRASERTQHLISHINRILVSANLLEDPEVHAKWIEAMSYPTQSRLQSLVMAAAALSEPGMEDWTPVVRLVDSDTAAHLVQHLRLPARAVAAAISRASSDEALVRLLAVVKPDSLYTVEGLSALASRKPSALLELIVPPELLETALNEHHIAALWRADPPTEVQRWLVPLTRKQRLSPRLLRTALLALARAGQNSNEGSEAARASAETLIRDFVQQGFQLDERIYKRSAEIKLPRAKPGSATDQDVQRALNELFEK